MSLSRKLRNRLEGARLRLADPNAARVIARVRRAGLTFLEPAALHDLFAAVRDLEDQGIDGQIIEAGTARGGSAIVMAAAKNPRRPLLLYDAFEMIPPPSARDGDDAHARYATIRAGRAAGMRGRRYYGYETDLRVQVEDALSAAGYAPAASSIRLVQGYYEETLRVDGPVALAHIDCDWHDSVWTCLERITPYLVPGGRLVIDDYDHWSGCRRAVDAYFDGRMAGFRFERHSRLHIVRVPAGQVPA